MRLDPALIKRLDEAAKRLGSNRAALIRFCTQTFLEHFEAGGGVASLPMNWKQMLKQQDGRSNSQIVIMHNHGPLHHGSMKAAEEPPEHGGKKKKRKK